MLKINRTLSLLFASLIVVIASCDSGKKEAQTQLTEADPADAASNEQLVAPPANDLDTREHYELVTRETTVNLPAFLQHLRDSGLQDEDEYYLVEGDLLLTEEEVGRWFRAKPVSAGTGEELEEGSRARELLLNLTASGERDFWGETTQRHLTYAIDKDSFTEAEYADIVNLMTAAGGDWNAVCDDCLINFDHLLQFDDQPSHGSVKFIVRRVNASGRYIAAAFFPSWGQDRRYVNIDSSFFSNTLRFDRTGVLRHELGHVLGYRHEHIQGVRGCRSEGSDWVPLTPYNENSVMHYYCGGGGSLALEITEVDKSGHRDLYTSVPES